MSAHERTNWRDEKISHRHRDWGFNCPVVDLDFLAVEYNLGKPCAMVEYKHKYASFPNVKHPSYLALAELANNSRLPFLIVFYDDEEWWFRVHPMNQYARNLYTDGQIMSEREYVSSLYFIRNRVVENTVLRTLKTSKPLETEDLDIRSLLL